MCIRMKSEASIETILKAISNKIRLEILDYIIEEKFLIKNNLITHFKLQRAGLDFHLATLEEAGFIGLLEIKIKGRKYVFVYPKATWKINLDLLETKRLQDFLPSELIENDFPNLTERFWIGSSEIKNPHTIKKILESLAIKLGGHSSDNFCQRCKNALGIMKCSKCLKLYCTECAKIIIRSDKAKITFCYDCISDQFS